jgi:hypothetical protein
MDSTYFACNSLSHSKARGIRNIQKGVHSDVTLSGTQMLARVWALCEFKSIADHTQGADDTTSLHFLWSKRSGSTKDIDSSTNSRHGRNCSGTNALPCKLRAYNGVLCELTTYSPVVYYMYHLL